jgi:hypothetical protein
MSYARSQKLSPLSLELQVLFVLHELHTSYASAFAKLRATKTVDDATRTVEADYELAGFAQLQRREADARYVLKTYGPGAYSK